MAPDAAAKIMQKTTVVTSRSCPIGAVTCSIGKAESTAVVTAESGKTVNMRKAKSTKSKLVERVPIGATVRVLKTGENWSRVAYTDMRGAVWCGWMLNRFLKMETGEKTETPAASTQLYAVTIPYCTEEQARALLRNYAGAWMVKEEM